MIIGIGTDMIEIARIVRALEREGFAHKVFTAQELSWGRRTSFGEHLAGLFAAKEAVSKALGVGFSGFWPTDIEIDHNPEGKPLVLLHGKAQDTAASLGVTHMHISISHNRTMAVAYAVAEGRDNV